MPMRSASCPRATRSAFSTSSSFTISSAHSTACVACCASASGAPKYAISPSPMNLSSVPPWREQHLHHAPWYSLSSSTTCPGGELLAHRGEVADVAEQQRHLAQLRHLRGLALDCSRSATTGEK